MNDKPGEVTNGVRSILSNPRIYDLMQDALGAKRARRRLADNYIRAKPGDRVLDIGCGTADILDSLPDIEYLGFDTNESYIEAAQSRFAGRAEFIHGAVRDNHSFAVGQFDIVLAMGVIHHLNDSEAKALFRTANDALREGGRFLSLDGCYEKGQSPLARLFLKMDRGKHVRDRQGYVDLALAAFNNPRTHILTDLVRFPYTHLVMEAVK